MEFINEIKEHKGIFFYGLVLGLVITLILVWFSSSSEKLTVPSNAEARQLLKYHMNADPQDSRLHQRVERMTAKKATEHAEKYK